MKLICPECNTAYAIPDDALGDDGRTVRCKQCKHQWHARPERSEPEVEDFPDIDFDNLNTPTPGELPALSQPASQKAWMIGTGVLALCLLVIFMFHSRASLYSLMPGLYEAVGYYPNHSVVLANVSIEKQDSRRKKRYEISCLFLNTADTPQIQPPLAMRILSAGGNILAEDNAYLPQGDRMLEPGEQRDCGKLEVVHKFASADKLMLEIGSPLELGLRSSWNPEQVIEQEASHAED